MMLDTREIVRQELKAASAGMGSASGAALNSPTQKTIELTKDALALVNQSVAAALSPVILTGLVRVVDVAIIALLGIFISLVYLPLDEALTLKYVLANLAVASLTVVICQFLSLYAVHMFRQLGHQSLRMAAGWTLAFLGLLALAFFTKTSDSFSRVWFGTLYVVGFGSLVIARIVLFSLVHKWSTAGRLERRAVIVGGGAPAEELIDAFNASPNNDVRVMGIFDDRNDDRSPESVAGAPKLGNVGDLVEFARRTRIDLIIVSLPITAESRVLQLLKQLWVLPVDIRLSAHANKLRFRPRSYSYIGNVPLLDLFDKPIADWDVVMKWVFDRIIAALALLLLSPVMLGVALAVKFTSKGPVFFKQKRHGFNNELIEVYKFRSMFTDLCDAQAAKLVTKDDPRVTPVGKFIRKTSLDELPQLFNVLKGELSLVGPRPHALQAKADNQLYNDVVDGYYARHRVKPGITGWAQINGWRGETDTHEKIERRVEHDLYYIENWSVFLDLYILVMTPFSLISKQDNAY